MTGKRILGLLFALVIITGLVLGGIALYRLGFAQGAMTNITLPEGGEYPPMPYGYMQTGPRIGLLAIFPLLCLGGFFFLALLFGFGFMARNRAWPRHYGPGSRTDFWKHRGTHPWGPGHAPWEQAPGADDQPQTEPEASAAETDHPEE